MNTYRLLYRFGFIPWDRQPFPSELTALTEGAGALPPGRALDLGCGTGRHAVYLASLGWKVTAVDLVPRALAAARDRARAARVEVSFLEGDVTRLDALQLQPGYTLFLDAGCFHGLPPSSRAAYVSGVTRLRGPGAILFMLAFEPGWRGPMPRGVSAAEITHAFAPAWRIATSTRAQGLKLPALLRNSNPTWHLLSAGPEA